MHKLVIDTSNRYLYLTLIKGEKILAEKLLVGNNNHSEKLIDVIKETMKSLNLKASDLDQIYVGRGPGSYTGVRVACTVAKVLAYIKNIELYSFDSLDLVLSAQLEKNGRYVSYMDARRGFCYAKAVEVCGGLIKVRQSAIYISFEDLKTKYSDYQFISADIPNYKIMSLIKLGLFVKETNIHRFVPTYLRSGV